MTRPWFAVMGSRRDLILPTRTPGLPFPATIAGFAITFGVVGGGLALAWLIAAVCREVGRPNLDYLAALAIPVACTAYFLLARRFTIGR